MKRIFLLLSLSFFLLPSCDNSLDLTAEPTEIMVVYGLLSQNDTQHYLKITKAFITDGDAMVAAADPANSQYGPDELDVKIHVYRNGSVIHTMVFDTITIENKQPGPFFYPKQMVYTASGALDPANTYKLHILNKTTGLEVSSQTNLVGDITVLKPRFMQGFPLEKITLITTNVNSRYVVEWNTTPNGLIYNVNMRFHYKEISKIDNSVVNKYVDMGLGAQKASNLKPGAQFSPEKLSINLPAETFFKFLASKIPINPDVKRNATYVEFFFTAGTPELDTYIEVTKPSTGIIQERPEYTNITNGIGLFTSRVTMTSKAELSPTTVTHINLHQEARYLGFE